MGPPTCRQLADFYRALSAGTVRRTRGEVPIGLNAGRASARWAPMAIGRRAAANRLKILRSGVRLSSGPPFFARESANPRSRRGVSRGVTSPAAYNRFDQGGRRRGWGNHNGEEYETRRPSSSRGRSAGGGAKPADCVLIARCRGRSVRIQGEAPTGPGVSGGRQGGSLLPSCYQPMKD